MAMDGTPIIIKRKKAHEHAHHGGSWKVAYADFVTAMMAFFMVMWIMGLSDQTRSQVAGYFNDPMGYSKTPPLSRNIVNLQGTQTPKAGQSKAPGTEQIQSENKIESGIKEALKAVPKELQHFGKAVDVTTSAEGLRIEFQETRGTIYFETGSAQLTPDARNFIAALAPRLSRINHVMSFEGHTDARPYPGAAYDNFDLSTDRARSLKRELQQDGLPRKMLSSLAGYGDTKLKIPSHPYAAENRRVSIFIPYKENKEAKMDITEDQIKADLKGDLRPPGITPNPPDLQQIRSGFTHATRRP
jgi:chemotaxis protein MotB